MSEFFDKSWQVVGLEGTIEDLRTRLADAERRIAAVRELLEETGQEVWCTVCPRPKKPVGRSAPLETANGYCDDDCPGYRQDPRPGDLWPGETRAEFGYGVSVPALLDALDGEGDALRAAVEGENEARRERDALRHILTGPIAGVTEYRERVREERADDNWGGNDCSVCGDGVLYGSRHHQCGSAVMDIERERDEAHAKWQKAEQRLADAERRIAALTHALIVVLDALDDEGSEE